jgi:hypothetical protein
MYKLNLSIDDVNPKVGFRIIGEPVQKYLEDLHRQFGLLVTLFIPANHHGDALISDNKSWIQELNDLKFIEFGAHGYYHNTEDPSRWGECEFGELTDEFIIHERIQHISYAWNNSLGYLPHVWKSPGWLTSRNSCLALSIEFNCAVVHPIHNHNLSWNCKTIIAQDYLNSNSFPAMDSNIFILSHIHGKHDNVWNLNFYHWVQKILEQLDNQLPSGSLEMSFIKDL